MYYEDLLDSAVNDNSSVEFKLSQKETVYVLNRLDKQYEKYSIPFNDTWKDGKFYKRVTIENYGSGQFGTFIRNAVTGAKYNIIVGSAEQNILFKVVDTTGYKGRKVPLMLYYDSPEQYENHHFTEVSQRVKSKWLQSSLVAQKRLKESKRD